MDDVVEAYRISVIIVLIRDDARAEIQRQAALPLFISYLLTVQRRTDCRNFADEVQEAIQTSSKLGGRYHADLIQEPFGSSYLGHLSSQISCKRVFTFSNPET